MPFVLRITSGESAGEVFKLKDNSSYTIGRSIKADISVMEALISRKHCKIEIKSGVPVLYDLSSSNGTYVNEEKVARVELTNGDIISVGKTEILFQVDSEEGEEIFEPHVIQEKIPESIRETDVQKRLNIDEIKSRSSADLDIDPTFDKLRILHNIFSRIHSDGDIKSMTSFVLDSIFKLSGAERGAVLLLKKGSYDIVASRTLSSENIEISSTVLDEALKKREVILTSNAMGDERFLSGDSIFMQSIKSVMCVPMESEGKIMGAVYIDSRQVEGIFCENDMEMIGSIALHTGTAIEKITLMDNISSLFMGTIRSLIKAIEAKDKYTSGHSDRVASYALCIGKGLDLPSKMLAVLHLSGLLHDIGKIGVEEKILLKNGKLSDKEFEQVKAHPVRGVEIIENIKNIEDVTSAVKYHHEKFDGSGYPSGLKGNDIPLTARILAVADTYDAMTSDRPYRKSFAPEKAVDEIRKFTLKQFDPDITEVFLRLYNKSQILPDVDINHFFSSLKDELLSIWQ